MNLCAVLFFSFLTKKTKRTATHFLNCCSPSSNICEEKWFFFFPDTSVHQIVHVFGYSSNEYNASVLVCSGLKSGGCLHHYPLCCASETGSGKKKKRKQEPMKCNFSERQIEVRFGVKKFCILDNLNNSVSNRWKSTPQSPDITQMRKPSLDRRFKFWGE